MPSRKKGFAVVALAFSQPGIHAAGDVLDSGEAMIEQQLHRLC